MRFTGSWEEQTERCGQNVKDSLRFQLNESYRRLPCKRFAGIAIKRPNEDSAFSTYFFQVFCRRFMHYCREGRDSV